jgi:hypothetical protein
VVNDSLGLCDLGKLRQATLTAATATPP